jgi:hypothetical protein
LFLKIGFFSNFLHVSGQLLPFNSQPDLLSHLRDYSAIFAYFSEFFNMKWWIHRQQVFLYMKSGFKVKRRQKKRVKSREKNFKFLFMHFYWGGKNFICFMLIFLNLKSKASHLFFWVASSLSILCGSLVSSILLKPTANHIAQKRKQVNLSWEEDS